MLASMWAYKTANVPEYQNKQTNQQIEVTYLMAHSSSMFSKDLASLNIEPLCGIQDVIFWKKQYLNSGDYYDSLHLGICIRRQKCLNSEHRNKQTNQQQIEVTYLMAHSGSMFNKDLALLNVKPLCGIQEVIFWKMICI